MSGKSFEHRVGNAGGVEMRFIFGVRCLKRRRIGMNKRRNLVSVLLALFAGVVMVAGFAACSKKDVGVTKQAETSGTVTLYNGIGEEIESSWTYTDSGDMVALNFDGGAGSVYSFSFTDDTEQYYSGPGLTAFRDAVDKAIEWAAVAKEAKVQDTIKPIGDDEILRIPYLFNGRYTRGATMLLAFYFRVLDLKGKNETLLLIRYDTRDLSNGLYIAFKEKDFKRLKEILSDESFVEARNKAQEKAKTEDVFK
jgi:hypothetical protein